MDNHKLHSFNVPTSVTGYRPPATDHRLPTVLVTGGAGYIGSITAKELLDNGYDVVVLDSLERGHIEAVDKRAKLEIVDLKNIEDLETVFAKYKFDAVIDFAAYIAVGESMDNPAKYIDNNVFNFINLIEVMLKNHCPYLIKSSTASVYGNPTRREDFPLDERYTEKKKFESAELLTGTWNEEKIGGEAFLQKVIEYLEKNLPEMLKLSASDVEKLRISTSIYGLTKMLDEIIMKKYDDMSGLKYITLRYFNVAGAAINGEMGQVCEKPSHIFANAIFNLLGKNNELIIFGNDYETKDGTGIRDYIHVLDLASGHVAALRYLLRTHESNTVNLGTGQGYSVLEVIKAIETASGREVNYSFGPKRSGDVCEVFANPAKAGRLLGWKAKYSLSDMAETAWKWHSSHLDGYKSNKEKA